MGYPLLNSAAILYHPWEGEILCVSFVLLIFFSGRVKNVEVTGVIKGAVIFDPISVCRPPALQLWLTGRGRGGAEAAVAGV